MGLDLVLDLLRRCGHRDQIVISPGVEISSWLSAKVSVEVESLVGVGGI